MTDKEEVICKYKFQNKEKFNGKPYCTCVNELCEDLSFVCDHNCQIYEDYKQLQRKEQECEELKSKVEDYKETLDEIEKVCLEDTYTFANGTQVRYDSLDDILNTIHKAKGE